MPPRHEREQVLGRYVNDVLKGRDIFGNRLDRCHQGIHAMVRAQEDVRGFEVQLERAQGSSLRVAVFIDKVDFGGSRYHLVYRFIPERRRQDWLSNPLQSASRSVEVEAHSDDCLISRECAVLALLSAGKMTTDIAEELGISIHTVRNHVQRILEKLDSHSRLEAVAEARRRGLV